MYGRQYEWAQWHDALALARAGRGSTWVIHGPAGIGKTTLAHEVVRDAESEGLPVLWASGTPAGSRDEPGGVIRQWFAGSRARAALDADAFEGPGRHVRSLVRGEVEPGADLGYSVDWVLRSMSDKGPVLVVLDDAQWCDALSWGVFLRASAGFVAEPLILLAVIRAGGEPEHPDKVAELFSASHVKVSELAPLGAEEVASWSRDVLLDVSVSQGSDDIGQCLHNLTGGVPLLLADLFTFLAENPWRTRQELLDLLEPASLPSSVLAAVERRLRPHSDGVVSAVAGAALLGEDADTAGIASVLELPEQEVGAALRKAASAGLLQRDGVIWRCSHPLVAEAAIHGQAHAEVIHARAADLLRSRGASPERVAVHLMGTAPTADPQVADVLADAAERLLSGGVPDAAVAMLERARRERGLSDVQRARILTALGQAYLTRGEVDDALARWTESLDVLPYEKRMARELDLGDALYQVGRISEAQDRFNRVIDEVTHAHSDAISLSARRLLVARFAAVSWLIRPNQRLGWDEVDEVMASPPEHDGLGERALLTQMALELTLIGENAARAGDMAVRAAASFSFADEAALTGPLVSMLTGALNGSERDREALELMDQGLDEARRLGAVHSFATLSYCRSCVHLNRGRLRLARADAESALAAREHGWELYVEPTQATLVAALVASGEMDRARQVADDVDLSGAKGPLMLAMSHQTLGAVAAAEGAHEQALEHFTTAIELTAEHLTGPTYSMWWLGAIESACALDRYDVALKLATQTLTRGRAFGAPRTLGRILRACAKASNAREGEAMLVEAINLLEAHEGRYDLALAQTDLASLLIAGVRANPADLRRRARVVDLARRAVGLAHELGARPVAERAAAILEELDAKPASAGTPVEAVLTPSEERVCRFAAEGHSNREIAEHFFITRKAVEWHLSRSYAKLRITSRAQLADALAAEKVSAGAS